MPKRNDIQSILILGAGPIVIGQACEFDYSGAQACKALREEGFRVILVNSNPATIMTDPETPSLAYPYLPFALFTSLLYLIYFFPLHLSLHFLPLLSFYLCFFRFPLPTFFSPYPYELRTPRPLRAYTTPFSYAAT